MKQYIIIFLVCFLCLFFLGTGIFGVNGYLYNQDLKQQIKYAEYNRDKLQVEINSMNNQKSHLASEDGLRNLAVDLGYFVEGDTVYLFEEDSLQDEKYESKNVQSSGYKVISSGTILVIDLGISIILTFFIWFFSKDKHSNNYFDDGEDNPDQDIYINA